MTIPGSIFEQKNRLVNPTRFFWLYTITIPSDPVQVLRLVRNTDSVVYRDKTYSPFPIQHEPAQREIGGGLPLITLTVSNISREIISYLETYDGLIGETVTVELVSETSLGVGGEPIASESCKVINVSVDSEKATFTIGSSDIYQRSIPKLRITRYSCRHQYQSAACGYSLPSTNANYLATCDKTLDGANGCRAHGASYEASSLIPIHPLRFGGFPGVPSPNAGSVL